MRLETRTRRRGGLTLVEGRLHNDRRAPVRAVLDATLDPVYPPRSDGWPAEGWRPEEGELALVVGADQVVGVGYASPAVAGEQPLRIVETERDPATGGGLPATATGVARALGDPLPPPEIGVSASGDAEEPGDQRSTGRGARDSRHGAAADLRRLRRAAVAVADAATSVERRVAGGDRR